MKIKCKNCGNETEKEKWRVEHYKNLFCSIKCKGEWMSTQKGILAIRYKHGLSSGSKFVCINCNKEGIRNRHKQKYCNQKCQLDYEYKNGIRDRFEITKKANEAARKGDTYQNFRRRIFNFYPNICIICGSKENLEAHHIIPQEYNGRRASGKGDHRIRNGCILCEKCHQDMIHKRAERINTNIRT